MNPDFHEAQAIHRRVNSLDKEQLSRFALIQWEIVQVLWRCIHVDNSLLAQCKTFNKERYDELKTRREELDETILDLEKDLDKI